MNVPQPLEITASLLAGYYFEDGSLVEVDEAGDYRITDAEGDVVAETVDSVPGQQQGVYCHARRLAYEEIIASLCSFALHDAELYEFSSAGPWGKRYPASADDPETKDWVFGLSVGKWAYEHAEELAELASMDEEREEA